MSAPLNSMRVPFAFLVAAVLCLVTMHSASADDTAAPPRRPDQPRPNHAVRPAPHKGGKSRVDPLAGPFVQQGQCIVYNFEFPDFFDGSPTQFISEPSAAMLAGGLNVTVNPGTWWAVDDVAFYGVTPPSGRGAFVDNFGDSPQFSFVGRTCGSVSYWVYLWDPTDVTIQYLDQNGDTVATVVLAANTFTTDQWFQLSYTATGQPVAGVNFITNDGSQVLLVDDLTCCASACDCASTSPTCADTTAVASSDGQCVCLDFSGDAGTPCDPASVVSCVP